MNKIAITLILLLLTIVKTNALAYTITFTHEGSGSFELAGVAFPYTSFTINAFGNTDDRQTFTGGYFIDHISASILIDGFGEFDFITSTRTFFNNDLNLVGFSRSTIDGNDLFNGPLDNAFDGWEMLTSIGPITGDGDLMQWSAPFESVETNVGILVFDSASTPATFQASVAPIPEPSTFILLGAGFAGLAAIGMRRKNS